MTRAAIRSPGGVSGLATVLLAPSILGLAGCASSSPKGAIAPLADGSESSSPTMGMPWPAGFTLSTDTESCAAKRRMPPARVRAPAAARCRLRVLRRSVLGLPDLAGEPERGVQRLCKRRHQCRHDGLQAGRQPCCRAGQPVVVDHSGAVESRRLERWALCGHAVRIRHAEAGGLSDRGRQWQCPGRSAGMSLSCLRPGRTDRSLPLAVRPVQSDRAACCLPRAGAVVHRSGCDRAWRRVAAAACL